jgi:hypothetical protein
MREIIIGILSLEIVQGAIISVLLYLLGLVFYRWTWVKRIAQFIPDAYDYAEKEGWLKNLKGYQKWDPFFDRLFLKFREKYGREPNPMQRGIAVELNEKHIAEINKQREIDKKVQDSL